MSAANQNADQKIEQLLDVVRQKREAVKEAEKSAKRSWETNCSFRLADNQPPVNIQTANLATIHSLMTDLVIRNGSAAEAAKRLGIEDTSLTYAGFTFGQWESDMKKRVAILQLAAQRKKLDDADAKLNSLVSPEKRREMELAALEKELSV